MKEAIINIGKVNISSLAREVISKEDINISTYKIKHKDFGELCEEEVEIQLAFIKHKYRNNIKLFGIYKSSDNHEFYVIVDENRKNTDILLCSEYENLEII